MVPRIFGPYEPIRRDYPIEEFLADTEGLRRREGGLCPDQLGQGGFRERGRLPAETAEETGWPHAIVGYADMTVDDVRPQLDRLSKYPLLRGVRMQLHWHENRHYRFAAAADP